MEQVNLSKYTVDLTCALDTELHINNDIVPIIPQMKYVLVKIVEYTVAASMINHHPKKNCKSKKFQNRKHVNMHAQKEYQPNGTIF